jgi:hypothetical protein
MSITSANAVIAFGVPGLYPVPVKMSGFSTDKAWITEQVEVSESQRGVDGRKTSGIVYNMPVQNFSFQGDSPSRLFFNTIYNAQIAQGDVYYIIGTITLPSTGESFVCTKGTLKNWKPLPDGGKVLQPVEFAIEWESIAPTLI